MRGHILIIGIFLLALISSGCISQKPTPSLKTPEVEKIIVGGSESVLPIINSLAEGFEAENTGKKIIFGAPGHTGAGIKGVYNDIFTISALSRELKPEEEAYNLKVFWFATDALVFAAHPTINIKGLSSDEIRAIYYGETIDWGELGGPNNNIVVLDRPMDSSPKVLLYKTSFLDRERSITDRAVTLEKPQDMDIALISTPYSIGYTSLASIIKNNYDLNILALNGVTPSQNNVREGDYFLIRPQGVAIKGEPSGVTKEFIDFIFSEKGGIILSKYGYIPL